MPNEPASDPISKSARGEDKPIDARHPSIPFALVLGSYPILLVIVLLIILAVFYVLRS